MGACWYRSHIWLKLFTFIYAFQIQLRNFTDFNRHPFKTWSFKFENSKFLEILVIFFKNERVKYKLVKFFKGLYYLCKVTFSFHFEWSSWTKWILTLKSSSNNVWIPSKTFGNGKKFLRSSSDTPEIIYSFFPLWNSFTNIS